MTAAILRKIEACIALGSSDNDHEAIFAIVRARALMQTYNVAAEELSSEARAALAAGARFAVLPTAATMDRLQDAADLAERMSAQRRRARAIRLYGRRRSR